MKHTRMMFRWLLVLALILMPVFGQTQDIPPVDPVVAVEEPVAAEPAAVETTTSLNPEETPAAAGEIPAETTLTAPVSEAEPVPVSDAPAVEETPVMPTAAEVTSADMEPVVALAFQVTPEIIAQRLGTDRIALRTVLNQPAKAVIRLYEYNAAELTERAALDTDLKNIERKLVIARDTGQGTAEIAAIEVNKAAAGKKMTDWENKAQQRMVTDKPLQTISKEAVTDFTEEFSNLSSNTRFVIMVTATDGNGMSINHVVQSKTHTSFKPDSLQVFLIGLVLVLMIILSIEQAKGGKDFYIRRIAGLNAIDEAVGRATEMGKPVLYLTGLHDLSSIATLASISILSHVSQKTAEYETPILVPNCRSIVMVTVREVVKEAYIAAGKADHFQEDNITYLTDDQFGFTSGVDGIMVREKPAANFYLGHFMAESLIYAETGHSVGAIQIAGTEEFSQIPFFITACDYTLIGEELFAAGAYLSRQPRDVGSLRGQDIGKILVIALILIGTLLQTIGYLSGNPSLLAFRDWFQIN